MRSAERSELKWKRTRSRVNVSKVGKFTTPPANETSRKISEVQYSKAACIHLFVPSDPEVHIGLENLNHFPAFGSPPHNSNAQIQPEFTFAPPSPMSSSPPSGESSSAICIVLLCTDCLTSENCDLSIPSIVSDGMMFPSLNGQSSLPIASSVEDDSYCMSFAQVCMANT